MTIKYVPVIKNTEIDYFLVKSTKPEESFEEAFLKAISISTRLNNSRGTTTYEASVEEVVTE